jgi:hypothetical protein
MARKLQYMNHTLKPREYMKRTFFILMFFYLLVISLTLSAH